MECTCTRCTARLGTCRPIGGVVFFLRHAYNPETLMR